MEDFQRRLSELQQAAEQQKNRERWAQQAESLLASYDRREANERRAEVNQRRIAILERILESLNSHEALEALRDTDVARGYKGPVVTRNSEQSYVKIVLTRKRRRWWPYQVFVDQIGLRAYDAGSVYIEVAEFHRIGRVWKVIPLSAPLPYTPETRPDIENAISSALLKWASSQVRRG